MAQMSLKTRIYKNIIRKAPAIMFWMVALAMFGFSTTSCSSVYDDLDECPRGVTMRFVFDYNLEFANAFPNQVDCLTLYIFDKDGKLVKRLTETTSVLADEDWRLTLDLPAGDYHAVAYGGLECDKASFAHTTDIDNIKTLEDLQVRINEEHIGEETGRPASPLHDLYHGAVDFTVTEGLTYDKATVYMMRDTNHIRIVLQHLDNTPVNDKDFRFEIVDDNILFNHSNDVLPSRTVTYTPWTTGVANVGLNGLPEEPENKSSRADGDPVQVAYAELSVSRLIYDSKFEWQQPTGKAQRGPRLRILTKENGRIVCDIPLNNYLLVLKSEALGKMDNQEFLDRASRYNLVFFLDQDNAWVRMNIVVDDWTVRINNVDLD